MSYIYKILPKSLTSRFVMIKSSEFNKGKSQYNFDATVKQVTKKPQIEANIKIYRDWETDRKSTRLNSSHSRASRMPSSA